MKRTGNLWDDFITIENLYAAEKKAGKGKTTSENVVKTRADLDNKITALQECLLEDRYKTSKYTTYSVYEPKLRLIYTLPYYPDRIVHHALMNLLEPIWDKLFIDTSFACRKGKGQHKGMLKTCEYVRKYKYCAKLDISQFYVNIDHEVLKRILRKKLKDERILKLLDGVIDSVASREANINYLTKYLHRKDARIMYDKLMVYVNEFGDRKAGVPIGNYLSQWFGNLYMNEYDMFVKHELKCKAYVRYCDDFILFSNDKKELHEWAKKSKEFLYDNLKLLLSKSSVFPTTRGVDFLGYRMFAQGYVLLRKRTAKNIKKRFRKLDKLMRSGKVDWKKAQSVVASTKGWIKWSNTYNFRKSIKLSELEERIDFVMRGIPKVLSSKEDYYYVAENFDKDIWRPLWENLLFDDNIWIYVGEVEKAGEESDTVKYEELTEDGETSILKYEFVENPASIYKNLGFTKEEILSKLGEEDA